MPLESTPTVSPTTSSTAQAGSRHAGRRADGGAAAGSSFAQLLQGQRQAADALALPEPPAPAPDAKSASAKEGGEDATTTAEGGDEPQTPASKQPKKDQLSAEDLPVAPVAAQGAATAAGDTLGRLLGAQRAQARQAALGAERGRESRQSLGRSGEADAAAALAASPFADALARAGAKDATKADDLPAVAAPSAPGAALTSPQASGAEAVLPSLSAPGDVPAAPVAPPPPEAASAPDAYATLAPAPGTEAFPAALGAQLSTWVSEGVEHAVLELNPRELGPIEVHIAVQDGTTRIELGSEVASTRAALNDALPQLAEALGDVGLALAGGQVSDQAGGQRSPEGGDADAQARQAGAWLRGGSGIGEGVAMASTPLPRPPVNPRALLDMYA